MISLGELAYWTISFARSNNGGCENGAVDLAIYERPPTIIFIRQVDPTYVNKLK